MSVADDLDVLPFASAETWHGWLEQHHATSPGLWLKIAKKASGIDRVHHPQALEAALCFGWIDGRRRALDEQYFLQHFTPRRSRSRWSQINRASAEVQRARDDGRWDAAYAGQKTMQVPEDLQCELDARPRAAAFFAGLTSQNRYAILYRLHDAKKPETRAHRLATFVAMLEAGETIH